MYAHLPEESLSFPEALLAQTKRMRTPGRLMMRLRKPVAEHSWMTAPETINAFYTAVMNEIIIPLGILQPPFYKSGRPEVRIRGLTWCLYWQTLVLVLGDFVFPCHYNNNNNKNNSCQNIPYGRVVPVGTPIRQSVMNSF